MYNNEDEVHEKEIRYEKEVSIEEQPVISSK